MRPAPADAAAERDMLLAPSCTSPNRAPAAALDQHYAGIAEQVAALCAARNHRWRRW
jgi:hypothetical protein